MASCSDCTILLGRGRNLNELSTIFWERKYLEYQRSEFSSWGSPTRVTWSQHLKCVSGNFQKCFILINFLHPFWNDCSPVLSLLQQKEKHISSHHLPMLVEQNTKATRSMIQRSSASYNWLLKFCLKCRLKKKKNLISVVSKKLTSMDPFLFKVLLVIKWCVTTQFSASEYE